MAIDYDNMVKIQLTNGYYAIVDKEDVSLVQDYTWCVRMNKSNKPAGTTATINKKPTSMHTIIMNTPSGKVVDHVNNDALDNRKSNLRVCTQSENCKNRNVISREVMQCPNGTWKVRVNVVFEDFESKDDALKMLDDVKETLYGKFYRPQLLVKEKDIERFALIDRDKVVETITREIKPKTSNFKGVHWHKVANKWAASLMINRKSNHLGVFESEKVAAQAYDFEANKRLGERAILNLPNELLSESPRGEIKPPTSQFKGISWNKTECKWTATFKIDKKTYYLGRFTKEKTAAQVYDFEIVKILGDQVVLNFPNERLTELPQKEIGNKTSRFRGVCWNKNSQKWMANLTVNRKAFRLGLHSTEHQAALAYDVAAKDRLGDKATLNFPKEGIQ